MRVSVGGLGAFLFFPPRDNLGGVLMSSSLGSLKLAAHSAASSKTSGFGDVLGSSCDSGPGFRLFLLWLLGMFRLLSLSYPALEVGITAASSSCDCSLSEISYADSDPELSSGNTVPPSVSDSSSSMASFMPVLQAGSVKGVVFVNNPHNSLFQVKVLPGSEDEETVDCECPLSVQNPSSGFWISEEN